MSPGTALGFFWALGGISSTSLINAAVPLTLDQRQLRNVNSIVFLLTLENWPCGLLKNMVAAERNGAPFSRLKILRPDVSLQPSSSPVLRHGLWI